MRHYYLTRSGRLRRRDNTLLFELSGEREKAENLASEETENEEIAEELLSSIGREIGADGLGEFTLEEEAETGLAIATEQIFTILLKTA